MNSSITKLATEILAIAKVKREHLETYLSAETRKVTMLEFIFPKIRKHTEWMEKEALILGSPSKS